MLEKLNDINTPSKIKPFFSINDLREKDYENIALLPNERLALKNYDRYRITELNKHQKMDFTIDIFNFKLWQI